MATAKIILRKERTNKSGKAPLYLRIIKDRKPQYISLNLRVEPNYWNEEQQKLKKSFPNSNRINSWLKSKLLEVLNTSIVLAEKDEIFRTKDIKESILGKAAPKFLDYGYGFIKRNFFEKGKIRTYKRFRTSLHKLETYLNGRHFTIEDMTIPFLKEYEYYLRKEHQNCTNTIHTDLKSFRRIINEAIEEELFPFERNPFNRYKLSWEKTEKVYLTEEELLALEEIELMSGSKREIHRDAFVFACYVGGLRFSDIARLRWIHFNGSNITISTQKTKSTVSIKVPNKALAIIEKYNYLNTAPSAFIFPFLKTDEDYSEPGKLMSQINSKNAFANKNLGIIAKKLGLEKNISFHTSRHTWATRALRKGMRIEYVSKLMGHASVKTTQVYAKIVNEELDKAMDVFND